jgi:hypothetical protein
MLANLLLSAGSAFAALAFWTHVGIPRPVAYALGLLSLWQLRCAMTRRTQAPAILRLGGLSWDMFSFCRGWLITGQVGTGSRKHLETSGPFTSLWVRMVRVMRKAAYWRDEPMRSVLTL